MSAKRETPAEKSARLAARREVATEQPVNEGLTVSPVALVAAVDKVSTKDVRLSLDLKPALYEALGDWNRGAARALDRGRVTNAETLRALVRRLLADEELTAAVLADIREQQRSVVK